MEKMATAATYEFDTVIPRDEKNNIGKFKLTLDGLLKTSLAGTKFENSCIIAWCKLSDKTYVFRYELPPGATINTTTLAHKLEKGKMKVTFQKTSSFKVNPDGK